MTTTGQHTAPRPTTRPSAPPDPSPAAQDTPAGTTAPASRTLVVLGASRGTGALVAESALTAGHRVRAVSRSGTSPAPGAEAHALDATDAAALRPVLRGADAVLILVGAPGRDRSGLRTSVTRAALAAMEAEGVRRLVVLSSLGIGDSSWRIGPVTRHLVFPLLLPGAVADHTAQERLVTASDRDWTLLRPGYLGDGERDPRFAAVESGDARRLGAKVSRQDVAAFALDALGDPATVGRSYVLGTRR